MQRFQQNPAAHRSKLWPTHPHICPTPALPSPQIDCCVRSLSQGVRATHIIDGRQPHSLLMELLTDEGVGTVRRGLVVRLLGGWLGSLWCGCLGQAAMLGRPLLLAAKAGGACHG